MDDPPASGHPLFGRLHPRRCGSIDIAAEIEEEHHYARLECRHALSAPRAAVTRPAVSCGWVVAQAMGEPEYPARWAARPHPNRRAAVLTTSAPAIEMDEPRKYREVEREPLLLEVATVMFDADRLLHDQPLDLSNTHNWRHAGLPVSGITSTFRSATAGAADRPDACWSLANLDSPFSTNLKSHQRRVDLLLVPTHWRLHRR